MNTTLPLHLFLALVFAFGALASAPAEVLLQCGDGGAGTGDFNDRGFYVTNYPGTSIDTVCLRLTGLSAVPTDTTVRLEARLEAYDGPLVASGEVPVSLSSTPQEVIFPMLSDGSPGPAVPLGATLCFLLSESPAAPDATFLYGTVGTLGVDLPDPTDPCPHLVQTRGTTPPLDEFRREGVEITITGDPGGSALSTPPLDSYCHVATGANTLGHVTTLDHPVLNGNAGLKLFFSNDRGGVALDHPAALWFDGLHWTIFNEDFAAMPVGAQFNVLAFEPGSGVFSHLTAPDNISTNLTLLDHPFLNGNPSARPVVTRDWTIGEIYQPSHTGVRYSSSDQRWAIFNQDGTSMGENLNYNVHVDPAGAHSFLHVTSAGNLGPGALRTSLDHPRLNNNPDAKIAVSHSWTGASIDSPFGVLYDAGRWHILREDGGALPSNQRFHVLIGSPLAPSPSLEIDRADAQVKLWINHPCAGMLEHSTTLQDPWTPVVPTGNPFVFTPLERDFFRLPLGPDPAVLSLTAEIIRRDTPFEGRIRITATLRNLGGAYQSNPGQQSFILSQRPLGGSSTPVAQKDFASVGSGDFLSVSFERDWYRPDEFPPEFLVTIAYDPDILLDGNASNDDCHPLNNTTDILSGYEIHELFD